MSHYESNENAIENKNEWTKKNNFVIFMFNDLIQHSYYFYRLNLTFRVNRIMS